ncbi:ArsR family transcriptional regulator [Aeromicrobium sp. Root495]|uniref:helix-turn-helix transcriptional regulator n=1 Tax=Aeromicrobium sp. Root495 TaxID=1736550 RepID=UPI0006F3454E|nr:metalloregulator ArsR/SmtB family transcription factor [Aeromicrobium sp. Root495]KQY59361.1 ArsR family transcriptional regulator [Aeromicrobium sp. Root495]RYJ07509.1 MAG: transcriptional regulator [Actinomycetales bacterium]
MRPELSEVEASSVIDDAPTRERVVSTILEQGPTTAAVLAEQLGLTPAAVRRHLDQLEADGVVAVRQPRAEERRGRGRPAKVYVITDVGRDRFDHAYDALAVDALEFLSESAGPDAVKAFARHRLSGLKNRLLPLVEQAAPADRAAVVAQALTDDGFAASATSTPAGQQICQHHCPVSHVAEQFPQLCEAEAEMFAELLGTHVQRLATIAHGDGVCTTYLPRTVSEGQAATTERATS